MDKLPAEIDSLSGIDVWWRTARYGFDEGYYRPYGNGMGQFVIKGANGSYYDLDDEDVEIIGPSYVETYELPQSYWSEAYGNNLG